MNQEHEFTDQNCLDDFIEAKLRLITKPHNAFIGSLLYDLKFEPSRDTKFVELDSYQGTIKANPDYFCTLTHEQQATVLAHEVYHYALMHDSRRGARDPELYQKAADQVVNNLLSSGGFEMPPSVEFDTKYKNMSTEAVYRIMEKDNSDEDNNNNDSGSDSGNSPLGNDLRSSNNEVTSQIQQNILKANASEELTSGQGMQAGNSGSVFDQLFKDITEGKLNWVQILQEYFDEITQGEQDWSRFNRRYLQYDLYLPDTKTENFISKVAIAFDVSGSVTKSQIKAFLNEMKVIKNQLNPELLDVVSFNHQIVDIFSIQENDDFDKVSLKISGGTDLEPVFNHYTKPENEPKFLIVFSDLECLPIEKKPNFETIWVCIDNPNAEVNFGKLIHITDKELTNECL